MRRRSAFTLIELLVVILIIAIVSAVTLPTVVPAVQHRQVSEAARLVQASIEGAKDASLLARTPRVMAGMVQTPRAPRGIRLLPDPTFPGSATDPTVPLAFDRMIPIGPAPDYSEGRVNIAGGPGPTMPGTLALRVEESQQSPVGVMNARASWYWNLRVGDRIQIGVPPRYYTICGPVVDDNPDRFINVGPPGPPTTTGPWASVREPGSDVLFVVNGEDDDRDGFVDEGFDGLDNDGDDAIDEADEWEAEVWPDVQTILGVESLVDQPYNVRRRAYPVPGEQITVLPNDVVIDATTWSTTRERSRLPVDPKTLAVDLLVEADGRIVVSTVYSTPARDDYPFAHLWLSERGDVHAPEAAGVRRLPVPEGTPGVPAGETRALKGERRLITVNVRTGLVTTTDPQTFDPANVGAPFFGGQRGERDAL